MPEIKKNFNAFRIVITGKLRGGTSRTTQFSAGFGVIPLQTIEENIRYEFGNVRSKYGSFGVKLYTWRKSQAMQLENREMKWTSYVKNSKLPVVVLKAKKVILKLTKNKLKLKKSQNIRKFYYAYLNSLEVHATIKENKNDIAKLTKVFNYNRGKLSNQSKSVIRSKVKQLRVNNAALKSDKRKNAKVLTSCRRLLPYYYVVKIRLAALKNVKPSKVTSVELARQKLNERQLKKLSKIKLKLNVAKKVKLDKRRRRAYWNKRYGNKITKGKKQFNAKNKHFGNQNKNKRYNKHGNKNQHNLKRFSNNKFVKRPLSSAAFKNNKNVSNQNKRFASIVKKSRNINRRLSSNNLKTKPSLKTVIK